MNNDATGGVYNYDTTEVRSLLTPNSTPSNSPLVPGRYVDRPFGSSSSPRTPRRGEDSHHSSTSPTSSSSEENIYARQAQSSLEAQLNAPLTIDTVDDFNYFKTTLVSQPGRLITKSLTVGKLVSKALLEYAIENKDAFNGVECLTIDINDDSKLQIIPFFPVSQLIVITNSPLVKIEDQSIVKEIYIQCEPDECEGRKNMVVIGQISNLTKFTVTSQRDLRVILIPNSNRNIEGKIETSGIVEVNEELGVLALKGHCEIIAKDAWTVDESGKPKTKIRNTRDGRVRIYSPKNSRNSLSNSSQITSSDLNLTNETNVYRVSESSSGSSSEEDVAISSAIPAILTSAPKGTQEMMNAIADQSSDPVSVSIKNISDLFALQYLIEQKLVLVENIASIKLAQHDADLVAEVQKFLQSYTGHNISIDSDRDQSFTGNSRVQRWDSFSSGTNVPYTTISATGNGPINIYVGRSPESSASNLRLISQCMKTLPQLSMVLALYVFSTYMGVKTMA